jgi:phosphoribosylaminoimidazole carboxylase PurE protein
VIAAESILPVIGVHINATPLNGLDSLLSNAQMRGGIPVETVIIEKWGAKNAGLLTVQILALADDELGSKLVKHRKQQAKTVELKSKKLKTPHVANFKG